MPQVPTRVDENRIFGLSLWYSLEANGNIIDLSGNTPFKVYVCVSRGSSGYALHPEEHARPIDVLASETCLDISGALANGLISLVETRKQRVEEDYEGCESTVVPADFYEHHDYVEVPDRQTVRLTPAYLHPVYDPQRIECVLDPTITSNFRDGAVYRIAFPPEAREGGWNGGIDCHSREARVRLTRGPLYFKAMTDPPPPPKLEYDIDFFPPVLSLADLNSLRLTIKYRLCESTRYTVMWQRYNGNRNGAQKWTTALGPENVSSLGLELYDVASGERLSRCPLYTNSVVSYNLLRWNVKREQLRELIPGKGYIGESRLQVYHGDSKAALRKFFRIEADEELLGRRLALRLRPVQVFWAKESISELFRYGREVKPEKWYIPLTIESDASAEFRVVAQ